jgi:CARDB
MTERDSDIEFDFFEDLEPAEPAPPQEQPRPARPPGGRPPGPRRPVHGPTGVTPLLRLAGLIAFAILIIVLLVFWVNSCRGAGKKHSYSVYFEKVSGVAHDSQQIGTELTQDLTTPGIKALALEQKIRGLAQRMDQVVTSAEAMQPPGTLRDEQQSMLEALQFRVRGLRGLADAFRANAGSKSSDKGGLALAAQAQRLVASDVVWDDLFRTPSQQELVRQGVTGVAVPDSNFVPNNPDFGSPRFWVPILQRISGAATGGTTGGVHGTGLVSTKVLPSGQELSTSTENTITAGTNLGFAVTVKDTGDSQEVRVKVTLTIQQASPIVKTQTISLINPGEEKVVTFTGFNNPPVTYASVTTLKVDVAPVPGELNKNNNSAQYKVIFSLG